MNNFYKAGVGFGLTSGIITTMGIMMGLNSGTGLKLAVIGGVVTVAVADAFSDALGMHISQESNRKNGVSGIWQASIATFFTKLIVALTFLIPLLLFDLDVAVVVNVIWGFTLLGIFSYLLAEQRGESPYYSVFEHLSIAIFVIFVTDFIGKIIAVWFG